MLCGARSEDCRSEDGVSGTQRCDAAHSVTSRTRGIDQLVERELTESGGQWLWCKFLLTYARTILGGARRGALRLEFAVRLS